jgi:hypothetical protein
VVVGCASPAAPVGDGFAYAIVVGCAESVAPLIPLFTGALPNSAGTAEFETCFKEVSISEAFAFFGVVPVSLVRIIDTYTVLARRNTTTRIRTIVVAFFAIGLF